MNVHSSSSFYIGIDLAWASDNPSGVAVINNELELMSYCYCRDIGEIMEVVSQYPQSTVGIDAPLIIPNATGHRPNEREFLKVFSRYGLGVHAVNTTLFEKRFKQYAGFVLYKKLKAAGFDFVHGNLFEVYPHATILACFNDNRVLRYKASAPKPERLKALKQLQTSLFATLTVPNKLKTPIEKLKGKALKAEEDFLDALVCAYTLHHCTCHECLRFGEPEIGVLITPKPG